MTCKVCSREADETGYCDLHYKAHVNIVKACAAWKKGLNISWDEYLKEIKRNCLTGEWAKQVAIHLMKNEEIENDKTS